MMNSFTTILREYWNQRYLIPKGTWLIMIAYSLVAFGSPMPPKITWLEITMGCGLLTGGVLLAGPMIRQAQQQKLVLWCLGLTALLFIFPLCGGLMRGHVWPDIVRDIFPLSFLLMIPILLVFSDSSRHRADVRTLVASALVFVGICTAVTFFVGAINLFGSTDEMIAMMRGGLAQLLDTLQTSQELEAWQIERNARISVVFLKLYDPAMLFAAIFLSAWGVVLMLRSWLGWVPGMILSCIGITIAYGFMILGLRAYTALFVLAILMVCLTKWRERGLYVRLLPVFVVGCVALWPKIWAVMQLLWIKQQAVGTNGKAEEWWEVITTIYATPQTLLIGIGWGGTFENPILGEATRFTHSMLSFYLLKSGVIGLGILLTIIGLLLVQFQKNHENNNRLDTARLILLVSCLPPLLIGALFQPIYKMLSYGVILALLILTLHVRMKPGAVKTE